MVAVPLATIAVLCSDQWWALLPLTLCAWWWSPHEWGWEWLVAVGRGIVGTEWAYIGAGALAGFPNDRLPVAYVWIALPLIYATYSAGKRKR